LGVFLVGESLNFTHHKILADLRPVSMEYVIPRGGLFGAVACPHYLFELVSWLGLCLIFRHVSMFLFFSAMAIYLLIRSLQTLAWYRARFPDFPPHRKAILPFIL
jgi:very-long-chain enoyl-CoA reductase